MKKFAGIALAGLLLAAVPLAAQEAAAPEDTAAQTQETAAADTGTQAQEQQTAQTAQTEENSKWGDLSYRNVTVYKVLEHQDGYLIYYARTGNGIASVKIPKEWYNNKLTFRNMPPQINPLMTVITKGGEFHSVMLTLPPNRTHHVWGVCPRGTDFSDVQGLESIELEY